MGRRREKHGAESARNGWVWRVAIAMCLLFAGVSWGGSADEGTGWLDGPLEIWGGIDAGAIRFDFTPARQEWSIGAGKALGVRRWRMSFLGTGLSVSRADVSGEALASPEGLKDLQLEPWVGGCIECVLGGSLSFSFEGRWVPEVFSLGSSAREEEMRAAALLRVRW